MAAYGPPHYERPVIAVVATVVPGGPAGSGATATGSATQALNYLTDRRLDLGAPRIVTGIVTPAGPVLAAAGNVTVDTPIPVGSVTKSFTVRGDAAGGSRQNEPRPALGPLPARLRHR